MAYTDFVPEQASPEQSLAAIADAIRAGDSAAAGRLADRALALGLRHPLAHKARALAFQQNGQFDEALAAFNHARDLEPNDTHLLNAIGVCLLNLNKPFDAIKAFEDAILSDPRNAQAYYRKGWTLEMMGDRDEAERHYKRAVEIDPRHSEALASLAALLAVRGDHDEALALAERALRLDPSNSTADVALGVVDLAQKQFARAEGRFRAALDRGGLTFRAKAIVSGLLGDALDGQGRYAEAFASYRFEKNEKRQLYAQSYLGASRPAAEVARITAFVEASAADDWRSAAGKAPVRGHVFLVGFSRSGTTLLEQVLASHPDVVALEEQDFLAEPAEAYLSSDAAMRRLASMPHDALDAERGKYWERIRNYGLEPDGKVFVDKLPMNTLKLPLIAKLFPGARVIFALRDPRDVILSCYRRHFQINTIMFEFLTVEDAVELYTAVMELGTLCLDKLPLKAQVHRYEDMVADFDKSIASLCQFMDIEWSDAMRSFQDRTLLTVRSPSAAQIRQPLNSDSVGAWRHYREQLKPVLPLLRQWVERFGYPAD